MERNDLMILMALKQESKGLFESEGIKIYYTGVGKVKATYSAVKLIEIHKPKWVLNLGTAGSKRWPVGTLVECTEFVQRDGMFAPTQFAQGNTLIDPTQLIQRATPLFPQKTYKSTAISNLPQVTCGTADFVEFGEPKLACDIFDMEAYALAYVCDQQKIKFNAIKYITDSSDKNVLSDWTKNLEAASKALLAQFKKL